MNTNHSYILKCALLTLALMAVVTAVMAEPRFGRGGMHGDLFHLARLAEKLDLNDQQEQAVETLSNEMRTRIKPYVKTLVQGRREMKQLNQTDVFNEPAVRALAEQQSAALREMMIERARQHHALRQILNEEQRQKLEKMHKRHH